MVFVCPACGKVFGHRSNIRRHNIDVHDSSYKEGLGLVLIPPEKLAEIKKKAKLQQQNKRQRLLKEKKERAAKRGSPSCPPPRRSSRRHVSQTGGDFGGDVLPPFLPVRVAGPSGMNIPGVGVLAPSSQLVVGEAEFGKELCTRVTSMDETTQTETTSLSQVGDVSLPGEEVSVKFQTALELKLTSLPKFWTADEYHVEFIRVAREHSSWTEAQVLRYLSSHRPPSDLPPEFHRGGLAPHSAALIGNEAFIKSASDLIYMFIRH